MDLTLLAAELATLETDTSRSRSRSRCEGPPRRYGWKGGDDAVMPDEVAGEDLRVAEDERDDWPCEEDNDGDEVV